MDITHSNTNWISNHPDALPDFIIGGAMKSGTTTLHAILNQHPDISIAHDELGFFDMDSLLQHPDFGFFDSKIRTWTKQEIDSHPELYWNWYESKFSDLEGSIKGEDSATYLSSRKAAERIAMQDKPIKLIFILRHPTARTVSNYLHALKSGRAIYSLEDTLRYEPYSIIKRSLYKEQLEYYYSNIPKERIQVVLFEDLIVEPHASIMSICDFLGIDGLKLDRRIFETHSNKTKIPKYIGLQLKRNRLFRYYGEYRYSKFLPHSPKSLKSIPFHHRLLDKLHKRINPKTAHYKFRPNPSTLDYLDTYFKMELLGIDELTGMDIYTKWFKH